MLPTTGLVGGCGIGLSLFLVAIVGNVSPCPIHRHCEERSDEAIQSCCRSLDCFASLAMTAR